MKIKQFFAGLPCVIALAFLVLFIGCDNGTKDVNISGFSVKTVASVHAEKTSDGNYIIVSWVAVENGESYYVYVQEEGKKTPEFAGNGQYIYVYSMQDGYADYNWDVDHWSLKIDSYLFRTGARYRFGVQTVDVKGETFLSKIVWSADYMQF